MSATLRERTRLDHDCENCRGRNERLAMQLQRTTRLRVGHGGVRAHAGRGDVDIGVVSEPAELRVGQSRVFQYDIQGTGDGGVGDEDFCVAPTLVGGFDVEVVASIDGSRVARDTACVAAAPLDRTPHTFSFSREGSSPGEIDVRIAVIGRQSGNLLAEHSTTVQVVAGGDGGGTTAPPEDEEEEDDDGGLFDGPILPCFLDPNRACAVPETVGWGALGFATLILLVGR